MLKFQWNCECGQKNISENQEIAMLINGDFVRCLCPNCDQLKDVVFEIKVQK